MENFKTQFDIEKSEAERDQQLFKNKTRFEVEELLNKEREQALKIHKQL